MQIRVRQAEFPINCAEEEFLHDMMKTMKAIKIEARNQSDKLELRYLLTRMDCPLVLLPF
jgi:hypothetical protein